MLKRRKFLLYTLAAFAATPVWAFDKDMDLNDLAKFRSFGKNSKWAEADPFERARPGAVRLPLEAFHLTRKAKPYQKIMDIIAFAEAGAKGYDAVHMGARIKPPKRPTAMKIGQILNWISRTPGQPHAIGRYQFIPSTLRRLVRRAGISRSARFSPEIQDQLAKLLIQDAGYDKFLAGRISLSKFMDNLAWIWAGLPLRNGKSAYDKYAGNRATITRSFYATQMRQIFPS